MKEKVRTAVTLSDLTNGCKLQRRWSSSRQVIKLRKQHMHMLGYIGNVDKTLAYFNTPSNLTVKEKGMKTVLNRGTSNEKARTAVMLSILADGRTLPPLCHLAGKNDPRGAAAGRPYLMVPGKGWITND
jgi:hypothetical protein